MTVRIIVPILLVVAAALGGIAPVHAQEVIAVAHSADLEMAGEESLTIEGFTGGVGGTGPDASGGGAIVIQMLQQPTGTAAAATSAASSRYSAVAAAAH